MGLGMGLLLVVTTVKNVNVCFNKVVVSWFSRLVSVWTCVFASGISI